jgi:S1-C subfamily serine protease
VWDESRRSRNPSHTSQFGAVQAKGALKSLGFSLVAGAFRVIATSNLPFNCPVQAFISRAENRTQHPMIRRTICAALTGLVLLSIPALAQDRRVPSSPAEVRMSYAPVVQKAAPSVVNVYAARVVENRNPFMEDPFFRRFFGGGMGVPREQVQRSLGSGVIVDAGGLVMTNNHVIEGATEVKIALADKREFEAEILLKDARTDLAVLRVKNARERFTAIEIGNSDDLQVGDVVLALGNPFGVGQTVTHGIISALARTQVGITD